MTTLFRLWILREPKRFVRAERNTKSESSECQHSSAMICRRSGSLWITQAGEEAQCMYYEWKSTKGAVRRSRIWGEWHEWLLERGVLIR